MFILVTCTYAYFVKVISTNQACVICFLSFVLLYRSRLLPWLRIYHFSTVKHFYRTARDDRAASVQLTDHPYIFEMSRGVRVVVSTSFGDL